MSSESGRFASLSTGQLQSITDAKDAQNTKHATKFAVKVFREYLAEKKLPQDFENSCKSDLDRRLRNFYAEMRNTKGEYYKRTSLLSIRSGLARHLSKTLAFDITKDTEFRSSNDMFTSMLKLVQREGKGNVQHKDGIEPTDLKKLYESMAFNVNCPSGPLNKVWFELCLHFCRRGRENQRDLTPSMFQIKTDDCGKQYICQVQSEVTKNHQGLSSTDMNNKTIRMYATGDTFCPVKSYVKYIAKRNHECAALFQTPRNSFCDDDATWYENRPLGKNKLGSMMSDLSKFAELSKNYSNHCIRATAIMALDRAGFESRHIITVSGHRNEASIKSYSRDTSSDQKRKMSETISNLLPSTSSCDTDNTSTEGNESIMFADNCDDILCLSASQTERMLLDITNYETPGNAQ